MSDGSGKRIQTLLQKLCTIAEARTLTSATASIMKIVPMASIEEAAAGCGLCFLPQVPCIHVQVMLLEPGYIFSFV